MNRLLPLLAAAIILLPAAVVLAPAADAATTRTLAITNASAKPMVPFQGFDSNPPKLFDFNGDGKMEIIVQNDNHWVYVFDSKTGAILAQMKTTLPQYWGARSFNGVEAAAFEQGGPTRLVVANSAATITVYRFEKMQSTATKFVFVKEWERRLRDCHSDPGMDSKPVLADLDKDGRMEIVAATEERGLYALRASGAIMWKNCMGGGNAEPTIADVNLDGFPDVAFGSDGGVVSVLHGRTGSTIWSFNVLAAYRIGSGSMPVGVAVGQLDGVGGPDIVVGARDSHNPQVWSENHALLVALSSHGKVLWARQDAHGGNPLTYTRPIIVDAGNDGTPEVYWADWNTIGHKGGVRPEDSWAVTGPANFYRYDERGNMVWKTTLPTWWHNKDVPLADVDGDGVQEMLANGPGGPGNSHDGIWYLDTRNGAKEQFVDLWPWKMSRAPVVADLWRTGTMQFVLQGGPDDPSAGSGGAVLVYDTGVRYSSAWPHLPDPTVGPKTAPPPPDNSGSFAASFTIKSPNEWWQEVTVQPSTPRTITAVELRIGGADAAWVPMTKSSWGAWTASHHTPRGTTVEFLATDSGGAKSQSAPFTWLDGTTTKGSVTPGTTPPPPGFTASFQPASGINQWWVEAKVTASEPLARVEASTNGGAWTALARTDWGTWAKSYHVPSGSKVTFRATSTDGDTATSQAYTWP